MVSWHHKILTNSYKWNRGELGKHTIHTCEIQGKGNEPVVFTENSQGLLSLDQSEEVIRHCLAIEEVVYTQKEVPGNDEKAVSGNCVQPSSTSSQKTSKREQPTTLRTDLEIYGTFYFTLPLLQTWKSVSPPPFVVFPQPILGPSKVCLSPPRRVTLTSHRISPFLSKVAHLALSLSVLLYLFLAWNIYPFIYPLLSFTAPTPF